MNKLVGSLCILLLAGVANAAVINFEFGSINGQPLERGVTEIVLNPSETATINLWLTLETSGFPPSPEELGLLTYALSIYQVPEVPPDVEIIGYSNDLEPQYVYENYPGGGGAFTLSQILLADGHDPLGPGEYLVSDVVIHCLGPSEDWFFINDPNSDILLYRPDLVTSIPFTLGTGSTSLPLHLIQTPEPATLGLLALGGLAVLRRRR